MHVCASGGRELLRIRLWPRLPLSITSDQRVPLINGNIETFGSRTKALTLLVFT